MRTIKRADRLIERDPEVDYVDVPWTEDELEAEANEEMFDDNIELAEYWDEHFLDEDDHEPLEFER